MFAKLMEAARQDQKRAMLLVAGVVVLVLIIMGVRQAATGMSGKQKTLQQAMVKLLNAETMHAAVDFDLNLPAPVGGRERRLVDVAVDIEGDLKRTESQPEFNGELRLETSGRGIILFADGELRLLQDAITFRLDNLPTILNPNGNLVEKWTYVEVPALETRNDEVVRGALVDVVSGMDYLGKVDDEESEKLHFTRTFTEEQEQALIEAFRQGRSGNRGLHVVARLLRAYTVESFEVWVDVEEKTVSRMALRFVEGEGEELQEAATLALEFSDFGKEVTVEQPPKELTVRPEVFGRIFGRGEVTELEDAN